MLGSVPCGIWGLLNRLGGALCWAASCMIRQAQLWTVRACGVLCCGWELTGAAAAVWDSACEDCYPQQGEWCRVRRVSGRIRCSVSDGSVGCRVEGVFRVAWGLCVPDVQCSVQRAADTGRLP